MRATHVVLCDFALTSADGKPSIIGIFDTIRSPQTPFAFPRFCLAARMAFEASTSPRSHTLQISVQDPSGALMFQGGGPITLAPPPDPVRVVHFDSIMVFDAVPFAHFGVYTFSIAVDGVLAGTTQLNVVQVKGA